MTGRMERVRSGKLAEQMACHALNLDFVDGRGFDCVHRTKRRVTIEVKSRSEGTDGKVPRITLTPIKMTAKALVAIQFDRHGMLIEGIFVPMEDVRVLYESYLQKKRRQSHINWDEIRALPRTIDITSSLRRVESLV